MTEYLIPAHWVITGFLLLIWCVEKFGYGCTGYRFVYRMYAGLPLLVWITFIIQANQSLIHIPETMASLSVTTTVPATVAGHVNILQWVWFAGVAILLLQLLRSWLQLHRLPVEDVALGSIKAQVSKHITSPCLKGVFRPVILLPNGYRDKFSASELS